MITSNGPARRVVILPGDGVGPEVVREAEAVLRQSCADSAVPVEFEHRLIGGAATDEEGAALSEATLDACRHADAILLGAVGGPRWDQRRDHTRPGAGLLRLRRELGAYINLRPVTVHPALAGRSSLRREVVEGVDLVFVRELTGGIYFGAKTREGSGPEETAADTMTYTRGEIRRIVTFAFELARTRRGRLTSVDKANVLTTSRLWRDVVDDMAPDHPNVELEHQLVDSCAMRLLRSPRDFDVVVTENMFGDILSDEASMLCGSLGMLPSASLGGDCGLYEPVHGSAPDIAGNDSANPLGAILSAALLLEHSLRLPAAAASVRGAVDAVIASGTLTPDLGGAAGTRQVGAAVREALATRTPLIALQGAGA